MREGNSLEILVDTDTAKENVSRLAANLDCQIEIRKDDDYYVLVITNG